MKFFELFFIVPPSHKQAYSQQTEVNSYVTSGIKTDFKAKLPIFLETLASLKLVFSRQRNKKENKRFKEFH